MSQLPFPSLARVDARDKVTGALKYAADEARPDLAHAMLALSTIGAAAWWPSIQQLRGKSTACC